MRQRRLGLVVCIGLAAALAPAGATTTVSTLRYGRFGEVAIHRPATPTSVALFVSGDGGWNMGVVDMANELAARGALVVGIDIRSYLKAVEAASEKCVYAAADFEALSQFVQQKLGLPAYRNPVLVGYSSGATLVYAVLVEAPSGTFRGALSLGFCPDLLVRKPLCRGNGLEVKPGGKLGVLFQPAPNLESPWTAMIGEIDQVCSPAATAAFVKQVPSGELIVLPKVGHGYSVPRNWMPQFREAFDKLVAKGDGPPPALEAPAVADLPLVEVPASGAEGDVLAVILTGDGGWTGIDRFMGEALAAKGIPVVGLDSLKYFWKAHTPDGVGKDLERILRHYRDAWKRKRFLLVGYSFGADVLPFAARRLPDDLRAQIAALALLGAEGSAHFEFHFSDWLGGGGKNDLPVLPELTALKGTPVLCLYGEDDKHDFCHTAPADLVRATPLKGGHHFGGDYQPIVDALLAAARP